MTARGVLLPLLKDGRRTRVPGPQSLLRCAWLTWLIDTYGQRWFSERRRDPTGYRSFEAWKARRARTENA